MAVSLKNIAERAGVSAVTVSLALRDDPRISTARRVQIRQLADELGYRPNALAQAIRTRRSHTVGLLLADLGTASSNLKVEAIEQATLREKHQLLLGFTRGDEDRLVDYVAGMIARQVDGLIVFGPHGSHDGGIKGTWSRLRERLPTGAPPVVLADVQCNTDGLFPQVGVDRRAAMRTATQHLVSIGHRDIAYVGPSAGSDVEKWLGVIDGAKTKSKRAAAPVAKSGAKTVAKASINAGVRLRFFPLYGGEPVEAARVAGRGRPAGRPEHTTPCSAIDAAVKTADRLAALPRHERPTAVVAASDLLAMSVISRLSDHGLRVPADVSVTGFDGAETALRVFRPRLTTLHQPQEQLAREVMAALFVPAGGRPAALVTRYSEATFVVGDSTAPPPL